MCTSSSKDALKKHFESNIMKLTTTQLRSIIREEVQKASGRRRLSESHSRISANELAAWKSGDWGYVDEAVGDFMPGRDDKFRHPAKPPGMDGPKCEVCGRKFTEVEIQAYRDESRTAIPGYPAVHEECAEM